MRGLHLDSPPSWLRWPRRTARLRLTAVYGGLFLVSGAALLADHLHPVRPSRRHYDLRCPVSAVATVSSPGRFQPTSSCTSCSSGLSHGKHVGQAASAPDRARLLVNSGIALAIVAVLALLLGWLVAGRVLRPIRTITATARRISATNLHERLALQHADEEFKHLADTLDDLFARLEAAFEAQRHFVANASHELRTPLTAERTLLQVALDDPATPETGGPPARNARLQRRAKDTSSKPSSPLPAAKADSTTGNEPTWRTSADTVLPRPTIDANVSGCASRPTSAPAPRRRPQTHRTPRRQPRRQRRQPQRRRRARPYLHRHHRRQSGPLSDQHRTGHPARAKSTGSSNPSNDSTRRRPTTRTVTGSASPSSTPSLSPTTPRSPPIPLPNGGLSVNVTFFPISSPGSDPTGTKETTPSAATGGELPAGSGPAAHRSNRRTRSDLEPEGRRRVRRAGSFSGLQPGSGDIE